MRNILLGILVSLVTFSCSLLILDQTFKFHAAKSPQLGVFPVRSVTGNLSPTGGFWMIYDRRTGKRYCVRSGSEPEWRWANGSE
jgi:hypothetical protein